MSGGGAPDAAPVDGSALRVAVVAGQWHEQVAEGLLSGALRGLTECKVVAPRVVHAPGAFELPVLAKALAEHGSDAVICSFECTFCRSCAEAADFICPNCSGELVARPKRVTA